MLKHTGVRTKLFTMLKIAEIQCRLTARHSHCRGEHKDESDWWLYSRSKIYNIMTCKELARRLEGTGITSLVAHPGLSVTDHFGKSDSENKLSSKLIETYANSPIGQSSEAGAIPLEFACTAEQLEGRLPEGMLLVCTAIWLCVRGT